jgi:glycine cleavage system H lipoate-binding protein
VAIASNIKAMERVRLRKVRRLSVPGEVLVREGQEVGADTVIAKTDLVPGGPRVVDITAELGIRLTPDEIDKVLVKKVGDKVRAREVLGTYQRNFWSAVKDIYSPCDGTIEFISKTQRRIIVREDPRSAKPMSIVSVASKLQIWPWTIRMYTDVTEGQEVFAGQALASATNVGSVDYVYSPMAGVVERICPKSGTITIVRPVRPSQVRAHLPGIVTRVIPEEGAVIEATGAYLEGVFGVGGERYGEILVRSDGPDGRLDEAGVDVSCKGKVLIAGGFVSLEAMQKARMIGVRGIVAGGVNNIDLVQLLGKEISVGITGQEDTDMTIIVMEGFGSMPMNERVWQLLASRAGKVASLDGTTHIRAGAVRPQILVSNGVLEGNSPAMPEFEEGEGQDGRPPVTNLVPGDRVRCVRQPYFGLWGVVEDLPAAPMQVESEAYMEVAFVRLDDGRLVKVSEANLEVFRDSGAEVAGN